jgi:thiamine biosynthesis lipoprotein
MHTRSTPKRCVQARPEPSIRTNDYVHRSLDAMGCRFELMLCPSGSAHDRFHTESIADEMVELIQDWHNRLSLFSSGSLVSMINRSTPGVPVRMDREMFELLSLCECLCNETQGAFNIAAGTLMHTYGFRGAPTRKAQDDRIDLSCAYELDQDALSITRTHERIQLDLGAIAKGYVLDLIRDELRSYGIQRAFVHGGSSSILAHELAIDAARWHIAIGDDSGLYAALGSSSMSVSAHNGRTNEQGEGHIMDPISGQPAPQNHECIACVHPSAAIADAYTTALGVNPDLIDDLHEHGSSIAMIPSIQKTEHPEPIVRDRLGVFMARAANSNLSKTVQGLNT